MSLFSVGITGLLASQRSLATTGHNISNVNTPGYSRQRVELVTRPAQPVGGGYLGKGVAVDNIRRIYDDYLTTQVRIGTANVGQTRVLNELAAQVDNVLANPSSGLNSAIRDFFDAVQGVADDPASLAARQVLLSDAGTLVQRFHTLENRLSELRRGHSQRLGLTVGEINSLADSIASLNADIQLAIGSGNGDQPNDLLDQRDEMLRQLADLVGIDVLKQDDGAVNVFIGTGQALVIGAQANQLGLMADPYDPSRNIVGYGTGGAMTDISDVLKGGELSGLLDFRDQLLDPVQNAVGRVAIGLSATFNEQHRIGMDLDGLLGGDFFSTIDASSPVVRDRTGNVGTAVITAAVTTVADVTTSDYRLDLNAGGYKLTRLSDGIVFVLPPTFAAGTPEERDGVTLTLTGGAGVVGDSFAVVPTRHAPRDIALAISAVEKVAVAAPVRTSANIANTGSATISAGTVSAPADTNLLEPVLITFNSPPTTFAVNGVGTGNPPSVLYTPGADIVFNGWTVRIQGNPEAGDEFEVRPNVNGMGDNRNGLLLAQLQTSRTLSNGNASYEEAYGQMVVEVGATTRQTEINLNAQEVLLEQSQAARDSVSGVNLDEEAANLLRFQQSYQASAQVIAAADTVFQSLLDAVGR